MLIKEPAINYKKPTALARGHLRYMACIHKSCIFSDFIQSA